MKKNISSFTQHLNDKEFNENILPTFRGIRFNYKKPFVFDMETELPDYDYDYIFKTMFHGVIYRTLCFFYGKEITCTQYVEIFEKYISKTTSFGNKTYYFKNEPILKLFNKKNSFGHLCECIEPLNKEIIIKDTEELLSKKLVSKKRSFFLFKKNFFGNNNPKFKIKNKIIPLKIKEKDILDLD